MELDTVAVRTYSRSNSSQNLIKGIINQQMGESNVDLTSVVS